MAYYMRFIMTDEQNVSLIELESALRQIDNAYLIDRDQASHDEGALMHSGNVYAQIAINRSGDGIFDEEIEELKDFIEEVDGVNKLRVTDVLSEATSIVTVRVLSAGRDDEENLGTIDPLWRWLFANRTGLLQAGGEGYYDASGLVLEVM